MMYKIVTALLLFGLSVVAQMNPNAGVLDPAQLPVLDQNKVANLTSDLGGKQAAGVYMTGTTSPLGVSGTNVTCPNASDSVSGCLTATDHATFNGKQAALGFTPENVANKATNTSLGTSDTAYPSQNAVKIYVDTGLASKADATASTTVNGQACAIGSSCTVADSTKVPTTTTVNGHALISNVTVTASDLSLGSVTNDVQTKAAVVPNTAPSAGQVLLGNAGGTAYAPITLSGPVSVTSAGVTSVSTLNQNTTGTAGGLTSQYVDWNASSGGTSIANKPTIPTSSSWPNAGSCTNQVVTGLTNGAVPTCSNVSNTMLGAGAYVKAVFHGFCTGTVTSSVTYYTFAGFGSSTTACTGVVAAASGMKITSSGTIKNLYVNLSAAGKANDKVQLYKNGSATGAPTCTYGTGTSCSDTSTALTVAAGDVITAAVTSGASDGSANLAISFEFWN